MWKNCENCSLVNPSLRVLSIVMASSDQPEVPTNVSTTLPQADTLSDTEISNYDPSTVSVSPPDSAKIIPLRAQSTLSPVLGTPGTDTSVSLLSVGRPVQMLAIWGRSLPMTGTPSAVGAFHAHKSIPGQSYTGTPLRNAFLGQMPSNFHDPMGAIDIEASIVGKRLKVRM